MDYYRRNFCCHNCMFKILTNSYIQETYRTPSENEIFDSFTSFIQSVIVKNNDLIDIITEMAQSLFWDKIGNFNDYTEFEHLQLLNDLAKSVKNNVIEYVDSIP